VVNLKRKYSQKNILILGLYEFQFGCVTRLHCNVLICLLLNLLTEYAQKCYFKSVVYFSFIDAGDPALLHHNICNKSIDMGKIKELDINSLRQLCQSCGISTSNKSKASH
jgi:hypothetical protein